MDDRKQEEMDFHNTREIDRAQMSENEFLEKYSNKKFYVVTNKSRQYVREFLKANAFGKVVLDYCCGLGGVSLQMAEAGAEVYGIDISNESVNPTNPEEIAGAILYIVENLEHAREMGENGRQAVLEKFCWKTEARRLISLYESLSQ